MIPTLVSRAGGDDQAQYSAVAGGPAQAPGRVV
jgi:hypothetical protein